MDSVIINFRCAEVLKKPEIKTGKNGEYISFSVKADNAKFKIVCFDDERERNPYKRLLSAIEKGGVDADTYLQMECKPCPYDTFALSDAYWGKVSKEPNPTKVTLFTYKILDWDYLIPYKVHEKMKEQGTGNGSPVRRKIEPITVAQMGGSIL